MSNPHVHAMSSAKKYGGNLEDYLDIHEFMDLSKGYCPDNRHRVLTHTPFFVEQVIPRVFGFTRTNSGGKLYWVKQIGYDHITEDFRGHLPTVQDWIQDMPYQSWMQNGNQPPPSAKELVKYAPERTHLTRID